jgi:hypothetical protein
MSYVPKEILKGNLDPSISFYTSDQAFTTSKLVLDFRTMFYAFSKKIRIVNQDGTNNLTYRQGSPTNISKPVPPNSEVIIEGWESYIEVNPNGVSGSGYIEYDLVNLPDCFK